MATIIAYLMEYCDNKYIVGDYDEESARQSLMVFLGTDDEEIDEDIQIKTISELPCVGREEFVVDIAAISTM